VHTVSVVGGHTHDVPMPSEAALGVARAAVEEDCEFCRGIAYLAIDKCRDRAVGAEAHEL